MKKVLITGGAFGLGYELTKTFSKDYEVTITYNTSYEKALELRHDYKINIIKCDISDEDSIKKVFENNYDIIINNASISMDENIVDKSKEEFMKVLEVNLVGTFLMCREAIKKGVREIINISSTDSVDTYQSMNIDYSCSKAGINVLTKVIALTYPNIRIISILPNWIDTESVLSMDKQYLFNEMNRIGQKELLKKEIVANKILEIFENKNIKSGELIRIDEGDLNV